MRSDRPRRLRTALVAALGALSLGAVAVAVVAGTGAEERRLRAAKDRFAACADRDVECFAAPGAEIGMIAGLQGLVAFLETEVAKRDPAWDCHEATHHIGEQFFLAGGMTVVEPGAGEVCISGLYDGMFTGLGRAIPFEQLHDAGRDLCSRAETTFYSCMHGLGHAAMVASGFDPAPALALCDTIAEPLTARNCGMGITMEVPFEERPRVLTEFCGTGVSPAAAGCVNLGASALSYRKVPMAQGCAGLTSYVLEDCHYGYGWYVAWEPDGPYMSAAELCGAEPWCARGWGWGARYTRGPARAASECVAAFTGLTLAACRAGAAQDFLHDSTAPDRSFPFEPASVTKLPPDPASLTSP